MNYIQTLYIDFSKKPLKNSFGWARPEYHLMSWALSCLQLKKIYGNVELYANSTAAELLINDLKLPYSLVNTSLDNYKLIDPNLWALPKLYTYSLQTEPFLHIDGDVFLFDKLPDVLLQSALIAQNPEVATEYYTSTQKLLMEHFSYLPACVKSDFYSGIPINAVNAGVFGGQDVEFFKHYTAEAFEYVYRNKQHFKDIDIDKFNVFFEQHLFYVLAKNQQKEIRFLFDNIFDDRGYLFLGNFHETPFARNYLHLLGHFKRDEVTCLQMAAKLRELHPEYYYRIIELCIEKKVSLFTDFYNNKHFTTTTDYEELTKNSVNSFENQNFITDIPTSSKQFSALQAMFQNYIAVEMEPDDQANIISDLISFLVKLDGSMQTNATINEYYLYGRDLKAVNWHKELFEDMAAFENKCLVQTKGLHIIESRYDWAGLYNKLYRVSILYYENLNLEKGNFESLLVPELTNMRFTLYDLDDTEKIVFDLLSEPMTIKDLYLALEEYFEIDVIQNHYNEFDRLVQEVIKQLILIKAVQPINLPL